jgi:hypothetical protein
VYALRGAAKRWAELNQYIGGMLSEDFMDPKAYVRLLFDDETISQSRLYFWVIGCLNEFDISIEENMESNLSNRVNHEEYSVNRPKFNHNDKPFL